MECKLSLQEKYAINDDVWLSLRHYYKNKILLGTPFFTLVFVFCTWTTTEEFHGGIVIMIYWAFIYSISLLLFRKYLYETKYTLFIILLASSSISINFFIYSQVCVFRLFGQITFLIHLSISALTAVIYFHYCLKSYKKRWNLHKHHNENKVLDLVNGRYDFLNHFNTENTDKKWSSIDTKLAKLLLPIVPIAPVIGISFSKLDLREIVFIIGWTCSTFCAIGFLLPIAGVFVNYSQLLKYEKKIGKPIINGLLTK